MDKRKQELLAAARAKIAKLRPRERRLGVVGESGEIQPIVGPVRGDERNRNVERQDGR